MDIHERPHDDIWVTPQPYPDTRETTVTGSGERSDPVREPGLVDSIFGGGIPGLPGGSSAAASSASVQGGDQRIGPFSVGGPMTIGLGGSNVAATTTPGGTVPSTGRRPVGLLLLVVVALILVVS